jgi:hypothetical protein
MSGLTKQITITVLDGGFIVQLDNKQYAKADKKSVLRMVEDHIY